MNILIVSPHRDDAAFSLGLTVRSWLSQGHAISVLNCFTRSNYAPFADASHVHENDRVGFISALRLREDEAWQRQQKSSLLQLADLRLKDAPLRLPCPLEEICTRAVSASDRAHDVIAKAVEQADAAALVLPLALGGHVDHRTARQAALSKAAVIPLAFYEDLPYAAFPGVTPTIQSYVDDLGEQLGTRLYPSNSLGHDEAVAVEQKRRSALCYDSQIDTATADTIARFCVRYGGSERLWTNAAWLLLDPSLTCAMPILAT